MNILLNNKKIQYYESIWRKSIHSKTYDIFNNLFPFPTKKTTKLSLKYIKFMYKLKKIQNILVKLKKFKLYKNNKNCLISKTKNIGNKYFNLYNVIWDNTLLYYMKNYNVKPSNDFYNFIKNITIKKNKITLSKKYKYPYFKLKGITYKRYKKKNILIKKNQWRILDALYQDGSKKLYDYKNDLKYSEHSGLIDFNEKKIDKIIINARENYIDKYDDEIYFPENIIDEADYEFIFHTHPKTKNRIKDKIIYEFPSLGDLLNFRDNYKEGKTQGSIIIAPEGLYIITVLDHNYNINIPKKDIDELEYKLLDINLLAYKKYKNIYSNDIFYSKIIKDKYFINLFNKIILKYNMIVKYYNRIKYKKNYIIPDIYLNFSIIETKK